MILRLYSSFKCPYALYALYYYLIPYSWNITFVETGPARRVRSDTQPALDVGVMSETVRPCRAGEWECGPVMSRGGAYLRDHRGVGPLVVCPGARRNARGVAREPSWQWKYEGR